MTVDLDVILTARVGSPGRIAELAQSRGKPRDLTGQTGRLLIVAADHPARGALRAGQDPLAMADRADLLDRIVRALARPGVDGFLGTADVVEDLLLLGALEGKVVIGSMNRGGLAGTAFEMDDRFTGFTAEAIARCGYQGGKMLFRIDPSDPGSVATMQACAQATEELAARGLMAMIEPFISRRDENGRVVNVLTPEAIVRAATVSAGLASTSAYTWLKLPVIDDMDPVLAATSLPVVLLGGEVSADQGRQFAAWSRALKSPQVRGMAIGRSLLYPPGGNVERAVDAIVEMM
ncbi:Cgl0159 family (beta/alpha)8-fold protein [Amycolatopsis sp. CA-161197]|uniref:Cgl0159 family (beta/alpha)8-fold protein n=1 Tax=Amycolatopsis sp. CA-161197 TaxID=3239922 RepID=UPI003D8D0CE1